MEIILLAFIAVFLIYKSKGSENQVFNMNKYRISRYYQSIGKPASGEQEYHM